MTDTLISICIPVFNGEKTIKRAINSCLSQTYNNFEIILSDNHSNDKTLEVVQKHFSPEISKKKLIVIHRKENFGELNNFEFVIQNSKGEFVVLLGADDYLSKNYVSILYELCFKGNVGIGCGSVIRFDKYNTDKVIIPRYNYCNEFIKNMCSNKKLNYIHTGLWKRETYLHALSSISFKYSINHSSPDRLFVLAGVSYENYKYTISEDAIYYKDYTTSRGRAPIFKAYLYSLFNIFYLYRNKKNNFTVKVILYWFLFRTLGLIIFIFKLRLFINLFREIAKYLLPQKLYFRLKTFYRNL